jgi:hypothetical protein
VAALSTLAALAFAPAALATTVTNDGGTLTAVAGAGKINYLESYEGSGGIVIQEYQADDPDPNDDDYDRDEDPIVPAEGSGCESDGPYRVVCTGDYTARRLDAGDLDDDVNIYDLALPGALIGGDGDDDVEFYPEEDAPGTLEGGDGDDDLEAGNGVSVLRGGAGTDDLFDGGDEDDTLDGGAGADTSLRGGGGNDRILGGPGSDVFANVPESGSDTYAGGPGFDEIDYSTFSDPLAISQNGAADDGPTESFGDPRDNVGGDIEQITGGSEDDTITGGDVANLLIGNGGRDTLSGAGGDDTLIGDNELTLLIDESSGRADVLSGGDGNDDLNGHVGEDVLNGDAGDDSLDGGIEPDVLSGGEGVDTVDYDFDEVRPDALLCLLSGGSLGCAGNDVPPVVATFDGVADDGPRGEGDDLRGDVENVISGKGADRVLGSPASNLVDTGGGDDVVDVRDEATDFVACGPGFDRLVADLRDSFETSGVNRCETVDLPPAPLGPQPPAPDRVQPAGLQVTVNPPADRRGRRTFTTTGRVIPPKQIAAQDACGAPGGLVSVQVKARGTTISTRRVALASDCTFRSRVTFKFPVRFAKASKLKFTARFLGNTRLLGIAGKSKFVAVRR